MKNLLVVVVVFFGVVGTSHAQEKRTIAEISLKDKQSIILKNKLDQKVRVSCGNAALSKQGEINKLLEMSDVALFEEGKKGIGPCRISVNNTGKAWCKYYIKVNGQGYPNGSGCTDDYYSPESDKKGDFYNLMYFFREIVGSGLCVGTLN